MKNLWLWKKSSRYANKYTIKMHQTFFCHHSLQFSMISVDCLFIFQNHTYSLIFLLQIFKSFPIICLCIHLRLKGLSIFHANERIFTYSDHISHFSQFFPCCIKQVADSVLMCWDIRNEGNFGFFEYILLQLYIIYYIQHTRVYVCVCMYIGDKCLWKSI